MLNILNSNVMAGLISASSSGKLQQVATSEYNKAKSRGGEGAMERAMGYAVDSKQSAFSSLEDAKQAMEESTAKAGEEQKAEEKAALEKARAAKTAETNAENEQIAENNLQQTAIPQTQPAAVLELSSDYIETVQNASSDKHGTTPTVSGMKDVTVSKPDYVPNKPDVRPLSAKSRYKK